ncbi:MAG: calcium/sodium antiporter [Bryobacterales bacterium]|nr:calcium/sodium antiporter [Bryobacterales bacterium]
MISAGLLALGLALLYFGAEWLVHGATRLARLLGMRPFVIGLTLVAYGTSMPEAVVSALAAVQGKSEIAIGNVIGSNIANIGLILGITALIMPIAVQGRLIRREIPVLVISAVLVPLLLWDGVITRVEAGFLLLATALFTYAVTRQADADPDDDAEFAGPVEGGRLRYCLLSLAGLLTLMAGGKAFVDGASGLALALGITERVIGLTVVAAGTSAPELAASIVAAVRGHSAVAVGNVIGSNIFNTLFVLGTAGALHPIFGNLETMSVDLIGLAVFTIAGAVMVGWERHITRWEGAVLLAGYAGFIWWIVAHP